MHESGLACFLKEVDVGIQLYRNEGIQGFQGILKERYTDFLVHEIDKHGKVVHLNHLDVQEKWRKIKRVSQPARVDGPGNDSEAGTESLAKETHGITLEEEGLEKLEKEGLITQENRVRLEVWKSDEGMRKIPLVLQAVEEKERRTRIHQIIKDHFVQLSSEMVQDSLSSEKKIHLFFSPDILGRKRSNLVTRGSYERDTWPVERGNYCLFVLYKENKDTVEAISMIAKQLHITSKRFSFSGTKDRRGVTVQHMTLYRMEAERIASVNRCLPGVRVGNFSYVDRQLNLGELSGNSFTIVLRNVQGDRTKILEGLQCLAKDGFINYFGMQRFGTSTIGTHQIGRCILRGEWEKAVDLILMPRVGDHGQLNEARELWRKTRNVQSALELFPTKCVPERRLLEGLKQYGSRNFANAFSMIPRNMRMMYVHAYQSYVWNKMATLRIQKYGYKPVYGDLVIEEGLCLMEDTISLQEDDETNQENEEIISPSGPKVRAITQIEIDDGSVKLEDIVLPLPGHATVYPENDLRDDFKILLGHDGINFNEAFRKNKQFCLAGNYRKLIGKPYSMDWRFVNYNSPMEQLCQTDLNLLNGESSFIEKSEGKYLALLLELKLEPSQYATMALREIMRCDTSQAFQSQLNTKLNCNINYEIIK